MAMSVTYTTVAGMLMMENRGGVETAYLSDPLGNLIQCHDASGKKTYEAWYWSYGEVRASTGSNPSPWGFVGLLGYYTDALNFLYVRARHYRPNLTHWQTVDPGFPIEPIYSYGYNCPTRWVDPSGEWCITIPIITNPFWPWWDPFPGLWNPWPVWLKWCPGKFPTINVGPVYGNYCGPQTVAGKGGGIDDVDKCCAAHDACFGANNCSAFNQVFNLNCRNCTQSLCICLVKANCGWSIQCWKAKIAFITLFACNPIFSNPFRSQ